VGYAGNQALHLLQAHDRELLRLPVVVNALGVFAIEADNLPVFPVAGNPHFIAWLNSLCWHGLLLS